MLALQTLSRLITLVSGVRHKPFFLYLSPSGLSLRVIIFILENPMDAGSKILFIINKYSGTGYNPELEGKIIDYCAGADMDCTIEFTKKKGHGTDLAKAGVKNGFDAIFAVGGDGTVNEVARGMIHTALPMGIIPKGSGNGLALHLQIPLAIDRSLGVLKKSKTVAIDTFTINGHLSVNISGIGFDGYIANQFGKNGTRGLGGYGKLVFQNFCKYGEFAFDANLSGTRISGKSFILAVANSSQFGNNARIAQSASVCDHLLDICVIRKMPVWSALDFAHKMFRNNLEKSRFIKIHRHEALTVRTDKPIDYHVDGEPYGVASWFEVKLMAASLRVIVPNGAYVL